MALNETNKPAAAPLSAGDLAIYELSRGIGNPAVMFGPGKTIESAIVEQALLRIERAETALRELQDEIKKLEEAVSG
jgi:hypothetical protein